MDEMLTKDIINRGNLIYEQFLELVKAYMPQKWYESKLEFKIYDDNEINGRSWCEGNKDCIEINSGVIELYYNYFSKAMEYDKVSFLKNIMPDKGEEEIEEIFIEGVTFENGRPHFFDHRIIDDIKAKMLEIFVSRFIFLHELGHILNGHCKLLANKTHDTAYFMPMYYNDNNKPENETEALDIRTLEMDADAFAATQSMTHLLYLYEHSEEEIRVPYMEPLDIFYWWAFAIRSHFLICEDTFGDSALYNKWITHLPSNARWTMIYSSVTEVIDFYNKSREEKRLFKKKITEGALDAEIKFNNIKLTNYNWGEQIQNNGQYLKYSREVNANWEMLKKELGEYTRLPLYEDVD